MPELEQLMRVGAMLLRRWRVGSTRSVASGVFSPLGNDNHAAHQPNPWALFEKASQAVEKANEERRQADEKASQAVEKASQAVEKANEERHQAVEKANEERRQAVEKANEERRQADEKALETMTLLAAANKKLAAETR